MLAVNSKSAFCFLRETRCRVNDDRKVMTPVTSLLGAFTACRAGANVLVEHFTRVADDEFGERGVLVTAVGLGPMDMPLLSGEGRGRRRIPRDCRSVSKVPDDRDSDIEDMVPFVLAWSATAGRLPARPSRSTVDRDHVSPQLLRRLDAVLAQDTRQARNRRVAELCSEFAAALRNVEQSAGLCLRVRSSIRASSLSAACLAVRPRRWAYVPASRPLRNRADQRDETRITTERTLDSDARLPVVEHHDQFRTSHVRRPHGSATRGPQQLLPFHICEIHFSP